jgi:hypothetical protein
VPTDARRAVLGRLIDHAPLFPPASMPMTEAIEEDRRFRAGPDGWLVRRFVCPASRFDELGDELVPLAVVVDADARSLTHDPRVAAVEMKLGGKAPDGFQGEMYVEVPTDDGNLAKNLKLLAETGRRAKVRCGGAKVPSVSELASFIRHCRELRLPFKATAGLHHPLRGNGEHGFLNVVAAALFGDEEAALADEDPSSFALSADAFRWRARSATAGELVTLREELFSGFGSCSAQEPADELRALGFLP